MEYISSLESRIIDINSESIGVPAAILMENAGKHIARIAGKLGNEYILFCGPGNNGGDGFAAARYLGKNTFVYYFKAPVTEEAQEAYNKAYNKQGFKKVVGKASIKNIPKKAVVIDAIFGTGIHGKIKEPYRSVIELINRHKGTVVSIDVPSGMDPDTGRIFDISVKPDIIITLHKPKIGLRMIKKSVKVVDIGIPKKAEECVGLGDLLRIPKRGYYSKKGDNGKVLVVGGNERFIGAPYFAAIAALHAGCDLSFVAAPRRCADKVAVMSPDLIVEHMDSLDYLRRSDLADILEIDSDVLCVGNGLGKREETIDLVKAIINSVKKPIVLDGDGLAAIKGHIGKPALVITPHAGEFKMIFDVPVPNDLEKRAELVRRASKNFHGVILLKGPVDIIAKDGKIRFNETGNPHMAKGGTGDILAGVCAGLAAQKMGLFDAACVAAFLVGRAGDIAYENKGPTLIASDVLDNLADAYKA